MDTNERRMLQRVGHWMGVILAVLIALGIVGLVLAAAVSVNMWAWSTVLGGWP